MSTPTISRRAIDLTTPICEAPAASDSHTDQSVYDTQQSRVGVGSNFPATKSETAPNPRTSPGSTSDGGQPGDDAHQINAAVGADSPLAITGREGGSDLPADQGRSDDQPEIVGGDQTGADQQDSKKASQPKRAASLADPFLALAADILDDAENTRIANENRLRQLTRSEEDSDGEERGFGLDETHPDVARVAALVDLLKKVEHDATLNLNRLLRKHPLGPWVKAQKGIGEKQAARLLAVVGDPYVNMQTGEIRTVSQLWAYCGHGDPSRKKFKGMTQSDLFRLGNPTAKSRLWLIACAVLKAQGPLVSHYYDRKQATEGREHATACVRCGPSGKPAQPGSPWSDAHRHADALRVLGKEILRGLWLEAKRIHELSDDGQ